MFKVISYDFWNDKVLNTLGIFNSYNEAMNKASEVALSFSKGEPIVTSDFNQNTKCIKAIGSEKGCLVVFAS